MIYKRNSLTRIGVSASAVLTALVLLSPIAATAKEEIAQQTHDGLVLIPDRKAAMAYVDPEADFSGYNKVMILDCFVAFKKGWQKEHQRAGSHIRVSSSDMEEIKVAAADLFREVFAEELSKDGGYEIVDTAAEDVLLVRPAIIDLDVAAPDRNSSPGRSATFTTESGAATIFIELYDSVTGDILARAADRKTAGRVGGYLSYSNRVTNTADARRMMRGWAKSLRERLDEYHGK